MRKLLTTAALAISLGGCAFLQDIANPATAQNLTQAEAAYGVLLAAATGYHDACAAKTIPRACRAIVVKLQVADQDVQGALTAARNFIRDNPTLSPVDSIGVVQKAIADFKAVETKYGVKS